MQDLQILQANFASKISLFLFSIIPMEGRRTPTGPVSPLHDRATKNSVSPLHSQSTPKRSVSPFYNRTPTTSVSSINQHTPKRPASPLHNRTPRGSISPLHSRAPKGSVSPLHSQTSQRSVSPLLGQRPKGSNSPLHSQTTTSSFSSSHTLIPKRLPSSLHPQTSTNSGSSSHSITPKRSVSPFLGKNPNDSVSSLYSRTPKGSVSPLHDKASKRSVSPLLGQTSKGSVSPLHSQTPKRSVSPFQHRTPKRSVSPFQHQTPKGSVSPLQNQIPESSVSLSPDQTPEFSFSPPQNQENTPTDLISPQKIQEEIPQSSVSPLHDEEKTHEGSVSPLRTLAKPSPNYLKASSGTCHDICKYGARHDLEEEKGKHVVPKSFKKGQNHGERRKKTIIKLRSLSSGKIVFSEKIEIRVAESLSSNEKGSNPVEWQDIKSYDDASVPWTEAQNEGETMNSNSDVESNLVERRKKKQVLKSKEQETGFKSYDDASVPSTESQTEGEIMNRNSDVEPNLVERRKKQQVLKSKEPNERETPEKKELSSKKKKDSNKKPDSMKENTSLHERKATASAKPKLKEVSDENIRKSAKSKAIIRTPVEKGNTNDMHKPVAAKVENSPKKRTSFFALLRSSSGRRSHEGKSEKGVNRQKKGTNTASTSSHSETKEKILHMIEPKPRKITSKPSASKSTEEQDTLKPEKSTFRRGKVVERPPDPGTTKKLRFRKGRRSSENLGGFQMGRRSFRRKGSISAGSSNSHGQVVVLRHRETEEKKGIQGLFNSIIEETVNKLVKTRKSKVKALVGAFETVISLQDGKSVSVE
ncbi:protein FAM47C [Carex littledalei]|uniref:Protein FAM47C n=1 Tax=Carex littledalei TaxID=544730 RepID=A0A833VZ38_9POAL|nr:protein FAM47C [Carex littledalei]